MQVHVYKYNVRVECKIYKANIIISYINWEVMVKRKERKKNKQKSTISNNKDLTMGAKNNLVGNIKLN